MQRDQNRKQMVCYRPKAIVDQYMKDVKDTNDYRCFDNGEYLPIRDCDGSIHQSLPLELWPPQERYKKLSDYSWGYQRIYPRWKMFM